MCRKKSVYDYRVKLFLNVYCYLIGVLVRIKSVTSHFLYKQWHDPSDVNTGHTTSARPTGHKINAKWANEMQGTFNRIWYMWPIINYLKEKGLFISSLLVCDGIYF